MTIKISENHTIHPNHPQLDRTDFGDFNLEKWHSVFSQTATSMERTAQLQKILQELFRPMFCGYQLQAGDLIHLDPQSVRELTFILESVLQIRVTLHTLLGGLTFQELTQIVLDSL